MTGTSLVCCAALSRRSTSKPLISGMMRSSRTRSNSWPATSSSAAEALAAVDDLMSLAHQPARKHIAIRGIIVDHQDAARPHCLVHCAAGVQRLDAAQDVRKDADCRCTRHRSPRFPRFASARTCCRSERGADRRPLSALRDRPEAEVVVPLHVLDQQFAIALDGVERIPQVVPDSAVERFERFAVGRRTLSSMILLTNAFKWMLAVRIRSRSESRWSISRRRASSMMMSRKSVTAVAGACTS